jgi:hypothetical protein
MRPVCPILFLLFAVHSPAQDSDPKLSYAIPGDAFPAPSPKEQAAMLAGACEGKVDGGACDMCPQGSSVGGGGFTLKKVILGHFLGPRSTDALVTASGCEQMHASVGWGFLLTRREKEWQAVDEVLGLELDHCHRMAFRSGRDLLVCEDYRMESFQLMQSVTAVFAKGESIAFRNLLTAADTTRLCDQQSRVQKARIEKVEFRDQNGDGIEQVSFTASLGTMADSERRRKICADIDDGKFKARRPEPPVRKSYKIDYQFDGRQFRLLKESEAAAKLFWWEN